jgi:tRNA-guanine family transglycosylase
MSEYNEEIGSDHGIGMDQILREAEYDTASWKKNDMPGTETLRRMILLADWASREPKRWAAYKMFYYEGVGNPTTLVRGVAYGLDMYDCVLPTRTARMGSGFSTQGRINLRNAKFSHDAGPLDAGCTCPVCTGGYTRAYLNHLVRQKEMAGSILISMHNVYYLLDLMRRARQSIIDGTYSDFVREWMDSPASKDW